MQKFNFNDLPQNLKDIKIVDREDFAKTGITFGGLVVRLNDVIQFPETPMPFFDEFKRQNDEIVQVPKCIVAINDKAMGLPMSILVKTPFRLRDEFAEKHEFTRLMLGMHDNAERLDYLCGKTIKVTALEEGPAAKFDKDGNIMTDDKNEPLTQTKKFPVFEVIE